MGENNRAIQRTTCHHNNGGKAPCPVNGSAYIIGFGVLQILLSQIPDFDQLWWLSLVAAVMSFGYSTIGLGLGISKLVENKEIKGTLTGVSIGTVTPTGKMWRTFQALGNIAFAYAYSMIFVEIQVFYFYIRVCVRAIIAQSWFNDMIGCRTR